jgi:DNA-binding MarR family transcriptional regulator
MSESKQIETILSSLDTTVHNPARLGILILLSIHPQLTFNMLGEALQLTSGNLNSHIRKLLEDELIIMQKVFIELKPRTLLRISLQGSKALKNYVKAFKMIIKHIDQTGSMEGSGEFSTTS